MQFLYKSARVLSAPAIVFYSLPALMVLLVAGTLAQTEIGLYAAHQKYFASFIVWVGPLPLPGAYVLLGLLSINLLCKFLFFSEWRWGKAGIILSHLGALVILLGGFLTALTSREGYMVIPEGQSTPYIYDYHARELAVFRDKSPFATFDFYRLTPGETLENLPFKLTVLDTCKNCAFSERKKKSEFRDMARNMALSRTPPEPENEANIAGLTFRLNNLSDGQDGIYIAFEGMPQPIRITAQDGQVYNLIFGKQQRTLPFALYLDDFRKETYPGARAAKAYSSAVRVLEEDGLAWGELIAMNKPLRYKGYTFYQSSYEQTPLGDSTILSVVENRGRIFPYIGTLIIALGLALHFILTVSRKKT